MAVEVFLACAVTSCIYDDVQKEQPAVTTDRALLVFSIQLPMMRAGSGSGGKYEVGVGNENYIDITSDGFRIYLFGADDKYITRFIPVSFASSDNGASGTYNVVGTVPAEFKNPNRFKVVVLANWPTYSDEALISGSSSIDDLCNAEWAQFNRLTDFELNPDNGATIPFYGIHEYTDITFEKGKQTILQEPVALLRAMAKVEVVFDDASISLSSVVLRGSNSKGFCAPSGVYSQSDYDHNGDWNEDYVKTLHLPGDANEAGQENNVVSLYCKNKRKGSKKETWVCYVPEYRNTGSGDYKSRLELMLDVQRDDDTPFIVYFADYDKEGKLQNDSYFDIHRNNLYRFTVTIDSQGAIKVIVEKWTNAFDNNFTF